MKLLGRDTAEVIEGAKAIGLDEAYAMASQEGAVEIGGFMSPAQAKIRMKATGEHHLAIYSSRYPTPQQNLMECVRVARQIRATLQELEQ